MRLRQMLALVLCASILSCGGDDGGGSPEGPPKVYKKREAKNLKEEGTAETAEEKQRREEENRAAVARSTASGELRKIVRSLARAEDEFDMAEALTEIGALGEAAIGESKRVQGYLDHKDPGVRAAAYRAYGLLVGESAQTTIEKALQDDEAVVKKAGLVVWRERKFSRLAPVLALLRDFDASVQRAAMMVISQREQADATLVKDVLMRLDDMDGPAARLAIKFALKGRDKVPGLGAQVAGLLQHMHPGVRTDVVKALGSLKEKTPAVAGELLLILRDDPDEVVVKEAYKLLKAWAGSTAPAFDPTLDAEDEKRKTQYADWKGWMERNQSRFK